MHRDDADDFVDTAPPASLPSPSVLSGAAAPAPAPTLSAPVGVAEYVCVTLRVCVGVYERAI